MPCNYAFYVQINLSILCGQTNKQIKHQTQPPWFLIYNVVNLKKGKYKCNTINLCTCLFFLLSQRHVSKAILPRMGTCKIVFNILCTYLITIFL